jgi:hypothetical protein
MHGRYYPLPFGRRGVHGTLFEVVYKNEKEVESGVVVVLMQMYDKIRSGKGNCKQILVFVGDTMLAYLCLNVTYICQVQGINMDMKSLFTNKKKESNYWII